MDPTPPALPEPDAPLAPAVSHPWDGFLAGPENELAHASVLALARGDGEGISPLVLHGPSGVGKSRLLAGLVAERLLRRPESAVAHLGAEAFAAACAEAAGQPGGWAELRARFRRLDLFVLEDLHALERAPLALGELTHTLDALDEVGAAVAVSARVGPGQWSGWPSRLVNRLIGGLAVRIDPPGLASRRRYLLERARSRGVSLTADAVEALAEAADGYRTLDGWLARLALTARLEPPTARPRPGRSLPGRRCLDARADDRAGRPRRGNEVWRHAPRPPRHHPPQDDRRAEAPGDAPGTLGDRPELPGHRRLLRRPRPGHGPPRLPDGRRPPRHRPRPGRRRRRAPPPLASRRAGRLIPRSMTFLPLPPEEGRGEGQSR